ncbi:cytochrome P450 [Micromonospora sp. WMMD980]|uniref:cytochrome P450 n=1 Tax=Micromonospora sp. WMMD980 TaxID=3016088 RepID=UPI002417D2FB|nr:cytochrome P450 [Micromonospora sp. WMMD980]MDG4800842.1 cytochrome P450 [Micromonospora sp. WMMD980]
MTTARTRMPPRFDARDPAVVADPYPTYAALRAAGPLCRMGPGSWGVTRYADVARLVRDPRLGSEFPADYHRMSAGDGPAGSFFGSIILYRDPPEHGRLRRLMARAFSPALVRRLRPRIAAMVTELLDPAERAGRFDAVSDLAFPLPVMVVCALMGIPPADHERIRPHALDLSKAFAAIVPESDRPAADRAVEWLRGYLGEILDRRRAEPGDDLLSRMLAATDDDGAVLAADEIVDNAVFAFFAGFETTTNLIATGVAALLEHPDQQRLLRADPTLVPRAVEEFLRYDGPIQGVARLAREDVVIGDRTIRAGRVLILLLGSANRDPEQFADPDRLDVTREDNPHLSFGGGIHHCLGGYLARVEAQVTFETLLRRFPTLTAAGPARRQTDGTLRSYASVPVAVGP